MIPSLQPLVNLARLTRRAGDPEGAYREFEAIEHAIRNGEKVMIHGEPIDLNGLIVDCPSTADRWLRDVIRDEGTRALVAAGQWANAATHADKYDDAVMQLREARQTRIIARAPSGQTGAALGMVDNTAMSESAQVAGDLQISPYTLVAASLGRVRKALSVSSWPPGPRRSHLPAKLCGALTETSHARPELADSGPVCLG